MEVLDLCGKTISVGSYVIYNGTGTFGEVSDTKIDEGGTWAKIQDTQLWYNSEFLEIINQHEYERIHRRGRQRKEVDKVEKAVSLKKQLEDVDMSSELCDGGG